MDTMEDAPLPVVDDSKGALLVLFLVTVIDMIGFGIVIPFLTYLVEDLTPASQEASIGIWVGVLMTSYSAAQFLFSPFWGSLSDRIGRRPVLMVGLVGNTVFFTMFGLANTLLIALAARFLAGVFNGNLAVARAYIGDVSTPQQLATRMGLIGAAFGLGFTFGPFIGGELSDPASRWEVFAGTILTLTLTSCHVPWPVYCRFYRCWLLFETFLSRCLLSDEQRVSAPRGPVA